MYKDIQTSSSKIMEKIILEGFEKHLDGTVIGHRQHGFMREKSCLSNQTSFCNGVTHPVNLKKPVDIILDFSKAFNTVSHSIRLDKISGTQLDKCTTMGEQLAHGSGTQGCNEWGDIRVGTCH